jgi:hypothetical protein
MGPNPHLWLFLNARLSVFELCGGPLLLGELKKIFSEQCRHRAGEFFLWGWSFSRRHGVLGLCISAMRGVGVSWYAAIVCSAVAWGCVVLLRDVVMRAVVWRCDFFCRLCDACGVRWWRVDNVVIFCDGSWRMPVWDVDEVSMIDPVSWVHLIPFKE